jgi:hypothetical protein
MGMMRLARAFVGLSSQQRGALLNDLPNANRIVRAQRLKSFEVIARRFAGDLGTFVLCLGFGTLFGARHSFQLGKARTQFFNGGLLGTNLGLGLVGIEHNQRLTLADAIAWRNFDAYDRVQHARCDIGNAPRRGHRPAPNFDNLRRNACLSTGNGLPRFICFALLWTRARRRDSTQKCQNGNNNPESTS